jgi:hypothetical protein
VHFQNLVQSVQCEREKVTISHLGFLHFGSVLFSLRFPNGSFEMHSYSDGHLAVAGVDGATFRLYHGGELVLERACAYCATGHFESPYVKDSVDLGYALCAWRPLQEDCEDYSSEDLADF